MALPRLIPIEDLYANQEFSAATVSPDGTRIAYLAPWANRTQIFVRGLDQEHADAIRVTSDKRRGIKTYYWTDDPRFMLYLQDTDGNEDWHLFRVDLEDLDSPAVDLTPLPRGSRVWELAQPKSHPGAVLASINKRKDFVDVFKIDVATGETTLHLEVTDASGTYILGPKDDDFYRASSGADHAWEYYAINRESGDKRLIATFDGPSYPLAPMPHQATPDGEGLLIGVYPEGSNDLSLVRVDALTAEHTVVLARPGRNLCTGTLVSPQSVLTSKRTGEAFAARFIGDRPTYELIDPAYGPILEALTGLCDGVITSLSSDKDERYWVVTFAHDRDHLQSYLYDHETGTSKFLFKAFPHLNPDELASTQGVTYEARDGLPIHAFLTLPNGIEPAGLPLVLFVHGGPWVHDAWGYHPTTQLLANRGYAVLQINYRGSSGYGQKHMLAALDEFAGKMHDDLIDGAEWAVKQGYADPSRIGIYGGSYGGYAALVGVTFTPDFFAAAVDYCGISSLPNFIRTWGATYESWGANTFIRYCGDPKTEEGMEKLIARSPITFVDRITTPLLVVQGAMDVRVVQEEADNIVEALRARGVPVEYILAADEGHGFQNPENNFIMFRAVEKHFAEHLGGRSTESA